MGRPFIIGGATPNIVYFAFVPYLRFRNINATSNTGSSYVVVSLC